MTHALWNWHPPGRGGGCSVAQLCPTLRPHGLQHPKLPCFTIS